MEATLNIPVTDLVEAPPALSRFRRGVEMNWVERIWSDLSADELEAVGLALGRIPHDHADSGLAELWQRFHRGLVGMFALPDHAGRIVAVTFYEVEERKDGTRVFVSLATGSVNPAERRLAQTDMVAMEDLARKLGCGLMRMETFRHGLARQLVGQGWFCGPLTLIKDLR